ncbi:ABC-type zinc uptake system zinc chaperone [Shewanella sp. AS1]|uniref:ABC-type zinc uptake system zinc chaperone n=1 Tax=Shewanella sp. AS1 TaxID=2907626 RepID=UPI001F3F5F1B|nr:ABC-type zinc uptake system zinc chaperone [Shewanella sp. AS1]MCE9679840.1 ABC-type zinc uptake system zinc chaperone [Shewanella sp. AS1]
MGIVKQGLARGVALWLCAILLCLSVTAPAHSLEHFDDTTAQVHCTLCIHKAHFNQLLPSSDFHFSLPESVSVVSAEPIFATLSTHTSYFQSRAPPYLS